VDVFYVDNGSGDKLTQVEHVARIEESLRKALAGAP